MSASGRPLRFLGYVVGGWVGLRAMMLVVPAVWSIAMPSAPMPEIAHRAFTDGVGPARHEVPLARAVFGPPRVGAPALASRQRGAQGPMGIAGIGWQEGTADLLLASTFGFERPRMTGGLVDRLGRIVAAHEGRGDAIAAGTGVAIGPPIGPGHWTGAAWLLWRPEMGSGLGSAPLLGGSQVGARLDYRLASGGAGQISVYGRVSRAFVGPSSEEGAVGLAWRAGKLPVSLLAERRVRLGSGGRHAFALLAAGGVGPREIAPRVELEGYAQAGLVGERLQDGFADGKASLGYRLTPPAARRSVTLGASLSGSVQPGAERVDVGPQLSLRLPVGAAGMRLSTEWRTRIMGGARPRSGPAITLVADF